MSKITIRTFIISAMVFVGTFSVLGLMAYQVVGLEKQMESQIATLEAERAQENSYYRLQKTYEETKGDRSQVQSFFLDRESNSIDLLNLIESTAPKAGVLLTTKSLDILETKGVDTKWVKATFAFSGSREKVHNFLKILETLPYVLQITSTNLKVVSSNAWSAEVTMQVQIYGYDE